MGNTRTRLGLAFAVMFVAIHPPVHAQNLRLNNASSPGAANNTISQLPEVTVTANRPTPIASASAATPGVDTTNGRPSSYTVLDSRSATRTNTPLINVPQSVQVISRKLIDDQGLNSLGSALINVSGVTPTRSDEILFIPPIVRGFPAEVYVDGLPIFAGNQQAYDPDGLVGIRRIDVLKGPSATLYGGGLGTPLGGVINLETERPSDKPGGYVAMRAGSFGTQNPSFDLTGPLTSTIDGRIAGSYQDNDS